MTKTEIDVVAYGYFQSYAIPMITKEQGAVEIELYGRLREFNQILVGDIEALALEERERREPDQTKWGVSE